MSTKAGVDVSEGDRQLLAFHERSKLISASTLALARRTSRAAFGLARAATGVTNQVSRITMEAIFAGGELLIMLQNAIISGTINPILALKAMAQIGLILALIAKAKAVDAQMTNKAARLEGLISAFEAMTY